MDRASETTNIGVLIKNFKVINNHRSRRFTILQLKMTKIVTFCLLIPIETCLFITF